jgi:hypothetical protein
MDFSAPTAGSVTLQTPDLNWPSGLNVAIGAASAQSAAITARAVLLSPDQNCWIAMGANPTAVVGAGSLFIPVGALVTLPIQPGQKIAVIQAGAAGNLSMIPCAYPG